MNIDAEAGVVIAKAICQAHNVTQAYPNCICRGRDTLCHAVELYKVDTVAAIRGLYRAHFVLLKLIPEPEGEAS